MRTPDLIAIVYFLFIKKKETPQIEETEAAPRELGAKKPATSTSEAPPAAPKKRSSIAACGRRWDRISFSART